MIIPLFIIQAVLTFLIHFIMMENAPYGGGEIGMVSMGLIITVPIQVIASCLLYLIFRNRVEYFIYLLASWFLLEIALTILMHSIPFFGMFEPGLLGYVSSTFAIPSLIATCMAIFIGWLYCKFSKTNRIK